METPTDGDAASSAASSLPHGCATDLAVAIRLLGIVVASVLALGCDRPAQSPGDTANELLCPELAGNVDPLELSYADAPAADARIRTFVAAARGLNDVTLEIERRALDACRHIRQDLGAPMAPPGATIDVECEPLRTTVTKLASEGVELRIAIAAPRCAADSGRKARCEAVLPAATDATGLCQATSAMYARCSLPSISFAASKNVVEAVRLGRTLEENLPTLLYAEMALAKRLADHVQTIVTASVRIGGELKDVGPHGLACVGLGAAVTARSADRLKSFVVASGALMAGLDPEIQAGEGAK